MNIPPHEKSSLKIGDVVSTVVGEGKEVRNSELYCWRNGRRFGEYFDLGEITLCVVLFFFGRGKELTSRFFLIEEYVWEDIVDEFEEEGRMELKLWRKKKTTGGKTT